MRRGPKRPPLAVALRADGSGVVRVGRTEGSADLAPLEARVEATSPSVAVELVDVTGRRSLPTCAAPAGPKCSRPAPRWTRPTWTGGFGDVHVAVPGAGSARVELHVDDVTRGWVEVDVWAGEILCPVTLRSYALGAVHRALGMVWSEGIAVDGAGVPVDLTIRSFGILSARDMPDVTVRLHEEDGWPPTGPTPCSWPPWLRPGWPRGCPVVGRRDATPCGPRGPDVAASRG